MKKNNRFGLVEVYTGNGKGKTTAALGVAFRAAGHGLNVRIIQFLKGAGYSGEVDAAKKFRNIELSQFGQECPWAKEMKKGEIKCGSCRYCFSVHADDKRRCEAGFEAAKEALASGQYDLVLLDELNVAMAGKLISVKEVLAALEDRDPKTEVILTGRGAPQAIIDVADLVTEMREVKHPMSKAKGFIGRLGIDY